MKAPAFQWYAAEYLADERVAQLSLESEAVYVRLLSYCWREGTIPANPAQCAPLCKYADVKVIKPALSLFMRAPGQSGRLIHKRLEEERDKQQAFKDKQVINGKLGGRPRKPNDNPDESQTKGLGYSGLTQTEPKKRSSTSSSFSSSRTSNDVAPSSAEQPSLKASPERQAAMASTDPDEEQHWSDGPLTKPGPFRVICERHPLGKGLAYEHYRKLALAAAEVKNISRTIAQWQSWIFKFLDHQKPAGGSLLTPADLATEARTGVHAPQSPDAYRYELSPEATARRRRQAEEQQANVIAANLERIERNDALRLQQSLSAGRLSTPLPA